MNNSLIITLWIYKTIKASLPLYNDSRKLRGLFVLLIICLGKKAWNPHCLPNFLLLSQTKHYQLWCYSSEKYACYSFRFPFFFFKESLSTFMTLYSWLLKKNAWLMCLVISFFFLSSYKKKTVHHLSQQRNQNCEKYSKFSWKSHHTTLKKKERKKEHTLHNVVLDTLWLEVLKKYKDCIVLSWKSLDHKPTGSGVASNNNNKEEHSRICNLEFAGLCW